MGAARPDDGRNDTTRERARQSPTFPPVNSEPGGGIIAADIIAAVVEGMRLFDIPRTIISRSEIAPALARHLLPRLCYVRHLSVAP